MVFIYSGTESKWLKWLAVIIFVFISFGTESKWLKWLTVMMAIKMRMMIVKMLASSFS